MKSLSSCIKAMWSMSAPVRWRAAVSIVVGLVRIAASLCFVWTSKHLVDIATGVSSDPLRQGIFLFIGVLVVQLGVVVFINWWDGYNYVKSQNILRQNLFGHVLRSRWDGRERFLSGDTVNRLEEDIRVTADLFTDRLPGLVISLLQLVAASVYLLTLAPNLLWVLLILMFTAAFCSKMFFKQLRKLMEAIRARESELQQLMQESLQHRVLVLTLTKAERVLDRFGWLQADVEDNTRKRLNYNALARGLMFFGFQAGHAVAFLWGIFGIISGTVTYGMMTAFLQLVGQVQRPVAGLGRQIPALIQAVTSIERLMDLMDLEEEPIEDEVQLQRAPEVTVTDVSYSYPGIDQPVLDGFSCKFASGSLTLIAGPTGIGKSTLIRLVLGLVQPSKGTVTVGGYPAGSSLRGNFMYVPQGNTLLSGTIRSNLLLANPEAGEAELKEALEIAAADFVFDLTKGLDTPCGEVGSGLSEGQTQRVAIARALLRPGGVLILDESTSALDSDTEERLLQNIYNRFRGEKTILFISHRASVSRFADAVVEIS